MWDRRRPGRRGEQSQRLSRSTGYLAIVEPGTSCLRLLVTEVTDKQAIVWGWDDGPGWSGTDLQRLVSTCGEMLSRAEAMAHRRADHWFPADHLLVGLPASRLRGRAWSITQRRTQPERPVEERELTALLGRALRLAINRLQSPAFRTSTPPQGGYAAADPDRERWLLVEATTVALTVDGRRVTDPIGFRGQEIGATVFAALATAETIEGWRRLAHLLEFSTLTLTAAPLALVLGLSEPQGVLVDIGAETTDLTLWRARRPVALDSLPIGAADFTLLLSRRWSLPPGEAERLKWAYVSGLLTEEDRMRVQQVILPAVRTWMGHAESALVRLNPGEPLPERLYLLGGGSVLPEMVEAARALAWSERLQFVRHPQVSRLGPTDVPGVVNRTELGRATGDGSALALAAWAARQVQPLDRPARILSELCESQCSK